MVLADEGEEPVRRDLKVGEEEGKNVEILSGLSKGDKIVKGAKDESDEEKADSETRCKEGGASIGNPTIFP